MIDLVLAGIDHEPVAGDWCWTCEISPAGWKILGVLFVLCVLSCIDWGGWGRKQK